MHKALLKRIAIIGPESTGKSTLAQDLASHFNTTWVPEYSRESIVESVMQSIAIYRGLRDVLFDQQVIRRTETEQKCVAYFEEIAKEAVSKE